MKDDRTVEAIIASVLDEIKLKGYSTQQPFVIGKVEERMLRFSALNGIELGCDDLYMSSKQLQHSMRFSKSQKDLGVDAQELIEFNGKRYVKIEADRKHEA